MTPHNDDKRLTVDDTSFDVMNNALRKREINEAANEAVENDRRMRRLNMDDSEESSANRLGFSFAYQFREILEKATREIPLKESLPEKFRSRVRKALESLDDNENIFDRDKLIEMVDDIKTGATSVIDGGAFYLVQYYIKGMNEPIRLRIKKSNNREKFDRGNRVHRQLSLMSEKGLLVGPRINPVLYSDGEKQLTVEPYVEHERLTDALRRKRPAGLHTMTGRSDEERASLLEKSLMDVTELSVALTSHRDLKNSDGERELKKNNGLLDWFRNFLPGNYVVEEQDPTDCFFKSFVVRAVPYLRERLVDKKGNLRRKRLQSKLFGKSEFSDERELARLFDRDFSRSYRKRNLHIVNKDSHTGNVLVRSDGSRVYCDFEHSYFDILEEQIAELVLTSGITDDSVIKSLAGRVYDRYSGEINVDKEEFLENLDRRMVEKYLTRAVRFLDFAKKSDGDERRTLEEQANSFYTFGLDKASSIGLFQFAQAVEKFSKKRLGLVRVSNTPDLESTVTSLVSDVSSNTFNYTPYKKPVSSRNIRDFAKRALITGAVATGGLAAIVGLAKIGHQDEIKVDYLKNFMQPQVLQRLSNNSAGVPINDGIGMDVSRRFSREEILTQIFETNDIESINIMIDGYSSKLSLPDIYESPWMIRNVSQVWNVDKNLLAAIHLVGLKQDDPIIIDKRKKDDVWGSRLISSHNPFFQQELRLGTIGNPIDAIDATASAKTLALYNLITPGRIGHIVPNYIVGYPIYPEDSSSNPNARGKSRSYWDVRTNLLSDTDREISDRVILTYLMLNGVDVLNNGKPRKVVEEEE